MPAASLSDERRRSARITVAAAALVVFLVPVAASGSAPFELVDRAEDISRQLFAGTITPDGTRGFFASGVNFAHGPARIIEVDLATMESVRGYTHSGNSPIESAVIDPGGKFAYFGTSGLGVTRVLRIDLASNTLVEGAETSDVPLSVAVIDPDGRYAYFAERSSPHNVYRYRLFEDGSGNLPPRRAGTLRGPGGGVAFSSGIMDPDGRYAYFGTGSTGGASGRIVRIEVRDLDGAPVFRVPAAPAASHLELEPAEQRLVAAVIHPSGDHAYFAVAPATGTGSGRIVKVDLRTFTRVGAIDVVLDSSGLLTSAVIDPAGEFAYFATSESPARIHRVQLAGATCATGVDCAGMEVVSTITLSSNENDVRSAVIAPDGRFAYFGTNTSPGRVVRVRIADDPPPPPLTTSEPASGPVPPSVACVPGDVSVGATVVCSVSGGDAGIDILWRAAYNPVIAEAGVTLDASGSGEFSFVVPAAALGEELTVELVEWTPPMSLGVVAPPVPSAVPAGEGTPAWPLWALLMALAVALALIRLPEGVRARRGA